MFSHLCVPNKLKDINSMKTITITLITLFCMQAPLGSSLTIAEAINLAGRQRMLSQRITKATPF